MNIKDLRPASEFAQRYGAKCLVYGPPGGSKTPTINTAPRPVLCCVEPGMLSMRDSSVPTWLADTPAKCDEFFKWVFNSEETKNFDTICLDSLSQMAEMYVTAEVAKGGHGLQAYGAMATKVEKHMTDLFYTKQKHTYVIAKQMTVEFKSGPVFRPYFPGKQLNTTMPHLWDVILYLSRVDIPGVGNVPAFRTRDSFDVSARDRSGLLAELEPADLTALFNKVCGN